MEFVQLPDSYTHLAPDGAEVRELIKGNAGELSHFRLPEGLSSKAKSHKTIEEIWYIILGSGEMCVSDTVVDLKPGSSVRIPPQTRFQFRNLGSGPLEVVAATMPCWPGPDEAVDAEPYWE